VRSAEAAGRTKLKRSLSLTQRRYALNSAAALLVGGFVLLVTQRLPYYPLGWRWLIALMVIGLWAFRPAVGMVAALAALLLPVVSHSIVLGVLYFLLLAPIALLGPYGFLALAATAAAAPSAPALMSAMYAAPLLAGFLRPRRAAVVAGLACLAATGIGLLRGGAATLLPLAGSQPHGIVLVRTGPVANLADFSWFGPLADAEFGCHGESVTHGYAPALLALLFRPFGESPILVAQVVLWALAAIASSFFLHRSSWRALPLRLQAVAAGALVLGVGCAILPPLLGAEGAGFVGILARIAPPALLVALVAPLLEETAGAWVPLPCHPGTLPGASPSPHGAPADLDSRAATETGAGIPSDTWDELAGMDDIRDELMAAVESQFDPSSRESLRRVSLRPVRGILLFGPPGTGKTKVARVIAHAANAAFFSVSGTEFTSKWYGESEANLRRIFEAAQRRRPAVLFFDELEAFLPRRGDMSRSDAPEKGILATFLAYTDGIRDMDGVLLVGATNHPELIDPAALRPGRFDKLIYLSAPGREARRAIFERYLRDKPLAPDVKTDTLAARTERFTGADIQFVCAEAMKAALKRGGRHPSPIALADLATAIGGTRPSVTIKMLREYEATSDQYGRRAGKAAVEDVVAKPDLRWDDVAGLEQAKEALHDAIELPLTHPEVLKEYGIAPRKGVLLFGPPGCGKTFLAKVVAGQAKAHFLHVKGPELLRHATGQSETQLRDLFIRARENTPCVLFFDEIDALAGARGTDEASGTRILTQFLTEMDGVEELKGVVVVAATNRPDTLDAALLRPGRLDRIVYIPPPDAPARAALFRMALAGKPVANDVDGNELAALTDGFSAADITALCNAAAMDAAKEALRTGERQTLDARRLRSQIARTSPSLTPQTIADYEALRDRLQR
jgi:transitional endoplasmic reticulum ATPase